MRTKIPRSSLRDAAQAYVRAGMAVLPITPGFKGPVLIHSGKGHQRASTDPAQIAEWWFMWPNANVAIATGPSELVVVDLDGADGRAAWRVLVPAGVEVWPRTPAVRTPRGLHLYFAHDHRRDPLPCSAGRLAEGVDIRGDGGYAIAPPSVVQGRPYRWANQSRGGLLPSVLWLPSWLVETVRQSSPQSVVQRDGPTAPVSDRYLRGAIHSAVERLRGAPVGTRNATLSAEVYSLARLARTEQDEDAIATAMVVAALDAGLTPRETEATIASAFNGRARKGQP